MRFASKIESIKNDILGKDYSLSIAYVDEKKSREINKKYRKKDRATNLLSFALRKNEGELVLCKVIIKKEALGHRPTGEAKNLKRTYRQWLGFLVIHGMLHLKGLEHSSTMSKLEEEYDQKYFYRNRRRLLDDKSRGRRIHQGRKKS